VWPNSRGTILVCLGEGNDSATIVDSFQCRARHFPCSCIVWASTAELRASSWPKTVSRCSAVHCCLAALLCGCPSKRQDNADGRPLMRSDMEDELATFLQALCLARSERRSPSDGHSASPVVQSRDQLTIRLVFPQRALSSLSMAIDIAATFSLQYVSIPTSEWQARVAKEKALQLAQLVPVGGASRASNAIKCTDIEATRGQPSSASRWSSQSPAFGQ